MSRTPILREEAPSGALCRICHGPGTGDADPLLSPCICSGSVRWVHRSCLDQWRAQATWPAAKACRCELCGALHLYELKAQPPFQALGQPLRRSGGMLVAIVLVASSEAATESGAAGLSTAGSLLGLWALGDLVAFAWALLRILAIGRNSAASRAVIRKDRSLGGAAWHSLLAAVMKRRPFLTHAQAVLQARGVTDREAAAQVDAADSRVGTRDVDASLEDGDPAAASASPDGSAVIGICCGACCAGVLASLALPLFAAAVLRDLYHLFSHPAAVRVARQLAAAGAIYFGVVLLLLFVATLCGPLPEVCRGASGMPVVRSLTAEERREALAGSCASGR